MSSEWCTTTNKEWIVLQGDMSNIAISIGDEIQSVTDHFDKCVECGCTDCIEHIIHLKARLGGLCNYIGCFRENWRKC